MWTSSQGMSDAFNPTVPSASSNSTMSNEYQLPQMSKSSRFPNWFPQRLSIPFTPAHPPASVFLGPTSTAQDTVPPNYALSETSPTALPANSSLSFTNSDVLSPIPGRNSVVTSPATYSNASGDDGKLLRSPGAGKRTGRPPKWDTQKTRQLIRNYLWSGIPLKKTLQLFHADENPDKPPLSDEQAKSQTNGAQKKLNQSIRRDPRRYRSTKRGKELHWRANPPKRTPRHSERNGTASDSKFPPEQYSTQRSFNMQAPSRSFSGLSISSQKAFSLLKNLTIKTEPEGPMSRQGTVIQPACNIPLYAGGRLPCPLPGDFLTLDSHLEDTLYIDYNPEKQHQYVSFDMIWADIRVERNLWVINRGLSGKAIAALSHLQKVPTAIKLDDTDAFGNTLMHFLAARHDSQEQLISLLGSPAMTDSYLLRQNTGGQSFLHVLAREWFSNPKEKSCPFWTLLGQIDQVFTTLAPLRDVYGRNFFHHVKLCLEDNATASDMIHAVIAVKKLDPSILCQRDAFGTDIVGPQAQPEEAMVSGMIVPSDGQSLPYRDYQLVTEDTYQHIFERAKVDKNIEDGYGRGALHALAITASKLQPNRKRKASEPLYSSRDIAPGIQQQQYQKVASPITTLETAIAPVSPTTIGEESTGEFAKKAQELINEGCSVSHYDRKGHTALMAFIELLPEDKSIELLLSTLVDAAVREGMLDARNRDGETALMVAARLGKISAVQALVSAGANQHTRHARHRHVRGLLQTIHHEMGKHKNDPRVVGPLDACLKVLAVPDKDVSSADAEPPKAVLFPDAIDEWGIELAIPSCHVVSNSV